MWVGLIVLAVAVLLWPTDKSRIQGSWVGDGVRLTVQDDSAVLEWEKTPGQSRTYFRLDSWASPARIHVFEADAPYVKRPVRVLGVTLWGPSTELPLTESRGIYELRGDRLKICLPLPGTDFPASFDPTLGAVFELHRE
jgi:uncharacterized protein (TIGR03067 family)